MPLTVLITGQIDRKSPVFPLFCRWIIQATARPGVRIVWVRWAEDVPNYQDFEASRRIEFVTIDDDPDHWSGRFHALNSYRQHRQMVAGSTVIDDDDWVIRMRPDVCIPWTSIDRSLRQIGSRVAWVPWAYATAPYYMCDYLFIARARSIKTWQSYRFEDFRPHLESLPDWVILSNEFPLDVGTHASFFTYGKNSISDLFDFNCLKYITTMQRQTQAFGRDEFLLKNIMGLCGASYLAYFQDLSDNFLISDSQHVFFTPNRMKKNGHYHIAACRNRLGDVREDGRIHFSPHATTIYDNDAAGYLRDAVTNHLFGPCHDSPSRGPILDMLTLRPDTERFKTSNLPSAVAV